jgi:hypothetical protein
VDIFTRSRSSDVGSLTDKVGAGAAFSSLNATDHDSCIELIKNSAFTSFRTFTDILKESRLALEPFYLVMEEIPLWFCSDAKNGYKGGASIAKRPQVETMFDKLWGKAGTAAVFVYVLNHYEAMFNASNQQTARDLESCRDQGYDRRFRFDVWYKLAKVLIVDWKTTTLWNDWADVLEESEKRGIKVIQNVNIVLRSRKRQVERRSNWWSLSLDSLAERSPCDGS